MLCPYAYALLLGVHAGLFKCLPKLIQPFAKLGFDSLREYDKGTVDSVNKYITNSENVRKRVRKYYNRESEVVFPPLSLDLFKDDNLVTNKPSDREYYLSFVQLHLIKCWFIS